MSLPVVHQAAGEFVSGDSWAGLDLRVLLLSDVSTAAPVKADRFVSTLVPASNELVNDDYTRKTLAGQVATYNTGTDFWEYAANTVTWTSLTAASLDQGLNGWAVYIHVTDDSDSLLIASKVFATIPLTGADVTCPWADGVIFTDEPPA